MFFMVCLFLMSFWACVEPIEECPKSEEATQAATHNDKALHVFFSCTPRDVW